MLEPLRAQPEAFSEWRASRGLPFPVEAAEDAAISIMDWLASSSGDVTKLQKVLDVIEHLTKVVDSEHLREKCARVKQTLKNINRDGGTDFFIPEDHRRDFRVHCDALEGAMQDFVQAKTWRRKEQLKPPPPPPEG